MKKLPIIESYWVEQGRFLAGEYPGSYNPEASRRRMDAFLETGINTFFDLTQSHELPSYEQVLKEQARIYETDAQYLRFAIRDHGVPSVATMTNLLNEMDKALENGRGIYVHCWGGVGRTGITVGCYLVRHGRSNEEALDLVQKLYKTRPGDHYLPRSPETDEQVQFVMNWIETPFASHRSKQNFCEG